MRPRNIVLYERLAYSAIALTIASMPLNWATISHYLAESPVLYPMTLGAIFALQFWWVWLVARKRKNWARWTSLALLLGSFPFMGMELGSRFTTNFIAAIAYYGIYLIWIAAVLLLFTGDAKEWFKPKAAD